MIKKLAGLCLLAAPCLAHGYTECTMPLSKVFTDQGGNFLIGTTGYFNGYMPPNAPGFASSVAAAIAARASDRPAVIRYNASGVDCANVPWNELITGIGF